MNEKLQEILDSLVNGNLSWVRDEVRHLDNADLMVILRAWETHEYNKIDE